MTTKTVYQYEPHCGLETARHRLQSQKYFKREITEADLARLECAEGRSQCAQCAERWSSIRAHRIWRAKRAVVLSGDPVCDYCGRMPATQTDHVVAKARGGTDDIENLAPACGRCNVRKGYLTPVEWLRTLEGSRIRRDRRGRTIPLPANPRLTTEQHARLAVLLLTPPTPDGGGSP